MKILVTLLIALMSTQYATTHDISDNTSVIVDHVEDGIVSVETTYKDDIQIFEVFEDELNSSVKDGESLDFTQVKGRFYHAMEVINYKDEEEVVYQFRSDDNSVWRLLTEEEVGEIPNFTDIYTLIFFDNGTTAENKSCDCIPEWECECELYDDIFLGIYKNS